MSVIVTVVTAEGLERVKHITVFAATAVVHPVKVVSWYLMALDSAGVSAAVMEDAEEAPV